MFTRRDLITRSTLLAAGTAAAGCTTHRSTSGLPSAPAPSDPLIDDIAERTFRFFWDVTPADTGLTPDRWPTRTFCSIAAVGFALTSYAIGVERGWVSRQAARERTLTTLRFFWNAPQGDAARGVTGHHGFFYHFLEFDTGHRYRDCELSSVDTALLLGGMLFAAEYFDGDHAEEAEIRDLASRIYARVDWRWMQARAPLICMGWKPESGFIPSDWRGYNEAMLVYVLALGTPDPGHRVGADAWTAWTASYPHSWRGRGETRFLAFAPHFGHQYSHCWIDFRGIRDAVMRAEGFDYFENSRRATYAQRAYAIANPLRWDGYDADVWGLTACDGPADVTFDFKGQRRTFRTYSARGPMGQPDEFDDGTIAPTAALASIAFAPEIVQPCAAAMHRRHGERIYGKYGFIDSFNPSFRWTDRRVQHGKVDPVKGWMADDYLGIDQGPIAVMIANHRDELVWKRMRASAPIRDGLMRAGFTGGWLT